MTFPAIHGPADPEEFSWQVQLDDEQELRPIDDRHAAVYYTGEEHLAFTITAESAHDVDGTTLAVSEGNVITLTVHHRAGNPAAGGQPFVYPITPGAGWEGGFHTFPAAVTTPASEPAPLPASCRVPDLRARSLRAARRMLRKAHCQLGFVRGQRNHGAKVVRQYRRPGKVLPAGTAVDVKVAS